MVDLDQIESQFRASIKTLPEFERPEVKAGLIVTDLPGPDAGNFADKIKAFLKVLGDLNWKVIGKDDYSSVSGVLKQVEDHKPDLIVTYRHLFESEDLPYSLGTYAEMLTQATSTPVLLCPKPSHSLIDKALENTDRIMVVTDRIIGDSKLLNWGLLLVEDGGRLRLTHVEDDATFERYIEVIGKIPGIDTEFAKKAIEKRLIEDASAYIEAVIEGVKLARPKVQMVSTVRMGHAASSYKSLVEEQETDILVFNTKDEDQLAMHGIAYSLAVELLDRPLLML